MSAIQLLAPRVGQAAACRALGLPRASSTAVCNRSRCQRRGPPPARFCRRRSGRRYWITCTRNAFGTRLRRRSTPRCWMKASTVLDRTMYRILAAEGESRERRDQLATPLPETPVTGHGSQPTLELGHHQTAGPAKWTYFYLYVILDVFSRYVVGWMVADAKVPNWPGGSSPNLRQAQIAPASSPSTPTGDPR